MTPHRFFFRWNIRSNLPICLPLRPSLVARATLVTLLCSAASASALPPIDNSVASRKIGHADPAAFDDPYLQSTRQADPYNADDDADPMWAAADAAAEDAGTLPVLNGKQNGGRAFHRAPAIARTLNYSVDPEEIVRSGYAQEFGGSYDVLVINTLDPLALAVAVINAQSPGVGAATNLVTSPFVAGQCLYYIQEIIIQGLPSACR